MGLVKCPDCGKMVSERIQECPNCGCPSSYFIKDDSENSIDKMLSDALSPEPTTI